MLHMIQYMNVTDRHRATAMTALMHSIARYKVGRMPISTSLLQANNCFCLNLSFLLEVE